MKFALWAGAIVSIVTIFSTALSAAEPEEKKKPKGPEELPALIAKLNDTGLRTAAALRTKDGNFVFFPVSLSPVLSSLGLGASGEALSEFKRSTGWAGFDRSSILGRVFQAQRNDDFKLTSANAIWSVKSLEAKWLEACKKDTGANIVKIAPDQDKDELAKTINKWFKDRTDGEVTDLVKKSDLDRVRFVVVNATTVEGKWAAPFNKDNTKEGDFTLLDGSKVKARIMTGKSLYHSFKLGGKARCVLFPVKGEVVFGAVLPDEGKFDEAFALINQPLIESLKDTLSEEAKLLTVQLPKMKMSPPNVDLIPAMRKLGINKAFEGAGSDGKVAFARITGEDIYVETFRQKSTFELNEIGFKGSSGTVAIAVPRNLTESVSFTRPFHYFVVDLKSGQLLIIGSVVNPTK